jgi:hypothetical protein
MAKGEILRLAVQKTGQARPTRLEIRRGRDHRSASAKQVARTSYRRVLERVLRRNFPEMTLAKLSTSMDLEKSFGPIYARGIVKRGQSAFAVLGVNAQEQQSSIDAALTFGILWLEVCRRTQLSMVIEGLKLFVPEGCSTMVRERMGRLSPASAKWQLYELDERTETIKDVEVNDRGNIATRLVRCPEEEEVYARFAEAIALVRTMLPEVEIGILTPAAISFRCHGLEFAQARLAATPGQLRSGPEIVFGVEAEERVLDGANFPQFERMVYGMAEVRHAEGPSDDRWWRLHPERWLESLVLKNICALDDQLDSKWRYSQVPAFSAADRGMIDVLALRRDRRLAVIELKANEDIHLPLQGIDYWQRVAWHHARGEFQKFGYFAGQELSSEPPLLIMVAPALHVHPATDTLLRYVSPEIDWVLLGIDERWRKEIRVVFRKRPEHVRLRTAG